MSKKVSMKRPSKKEIKEFAEFKDYNSKQHIHIFEEGFMLGWDLCIEKIPFKPHSKADEKLMEQIRKAAHLLKDKKIIV